MKESLSKKEILDRIGYFRNKQGISSYKLGLELGHSKTYFYRVESGEIQLTLDMLLDILEILKVSTSEFFCPILNKDDLMLIDEYNQLSAENKNVISDLIRKLK